MLAVSSNAMKRYDLFRSGLFSAILLIALTACENHPIPNNEEKNGGTPGENYESSFAPGDVDVDPDIPAQFPGGRQAMMQWLANNINYPQTAVDKGIQGKVYLRFVVDRRGNVGNVTVVRGVRDCAECDKEAARAVRAMPRWIPGKKDNKPVNSTFNLPITFKLQ